MIAKGGAKQTPIARFTFNADSTAGNESDT